MQVVAARMHCSDAAEHGAEKLRKVKYVKVGKGVRPQQ